MTDRVQWKQLLLFRPSFSFFSPTSAHFKAEIQAYVPQNIHKIYFFIKSQAHFSDEYFCIILCTYLAKFLPMVSKIYKTKDPFLFIVKVFNFFVMSLKTYMDIFSRIFRMITPKVKRQFLLFIALNCLTNVIFSYVANYC